MAHLTAGVDAGIGAAGDGEPGRGQSQHSRDRGLDGFLHGPPVQAELAQPEKSVPS